MLQRYVPHYINQTDNVYICIDYFNAMTLQQLQYIVAVERHRHFLKAAEECGVTQPTLSAMIQKLEDELDVKIFDRSRQPVEPTEIGLQIIHQAKTVLSNAFQLQDLVNQQRNGLKGELNLGIIPTIAPYLVPDFISAFVHKYPEINLSISELQTRQIVQHLKHSELHMAILSTPLEDPDLLEIPLYYERFVAYVSPKEELYTLDEISYNDMPLNKLWVMQEGHCLRNQIFHFCHDVQKRNNIYEAGSIDTLVSIVDKSGGYTIIPELHIPFLSTEQAKNVRPLVRPQANREVSIVIRPDFIREKLLNAVADTIKKIIPSSLLNERLKKYSLKI